MKFPRATRRLLLGYLLVHVIAAVAFALLLTMMVRDRMVRDAHAKMESVASLVAQQVETHQKPIASSELLDQLSLSGKTSGMRFSLVSHDGTVVGDSQSDDLESIGVGPEMLAWAGDEQGNKVYRGSTDPDLISVAQRIEDDREIGFLRVQAPMDSISDAVATVRNYVWIFAVALGAAMVGLMTFLSSNYMEPLKLFCSAAKQVGEGKDVSVPSVRHRDDEWGELEEAFEEMQTGLREREGQLVENSQRLEAVLSSMIEGVLALEPNGQILLANGAACRMLSLHREKIVGRKLAEVVRIPELSNAIEKSQRERTYSKAEFKTLGDSSRTLKARVSMLADEDQPRVAVVLHDVTELRQLETMRQDFVANVSHELKTPLASIKAYAETLRMGAIKDESRNVQFLEQIEFQADTLNHQIQDLLQLARVESGEKTFLIMDVDINIVCETLHRQFLDSALGRHLELHLRLAQSAPLARCDAGAIETVLKNLIVNAIHYTPEGGRVSIQTSVDEHWVVVSVVDTGIGIAPEQQARVFERFYRVDRARSRDMGGTGLGLAIVKHLTQAFGGTVTLESQLGKGSKFHVRLPLSVAK